MLYVCEKLKRFEVVRSGGLIFKTVTFDLCIHNEQNWDCNVYKASFSLTMNPFWFSGLNFARQKEFAAVGDTFTDDYLYKADYEILEYVKNTLTPNLILEFALQLEKEALIKRREDLLSELEQLDYKEKELSLYYAG